MIATLTLLAVVTPSLAESIDSQRGSARFDRTTLVIEKMDESIDFWRDVMGFELILEPKILPRAENVYFGWTEEAVVTFARFISPDGAGLGLLEVVQEDYASLNIADHHATGHGGVILVMVATNIDALHERAAESGAVLKPLGLSPTGLSKHMYLKSPSGHVLELYEWLPKD